jgi:hypothetical protein
MMNRESGPAARSVARRLRANQFELGPITAPAAGLADADFRHIWWS